MATPEAGRPGAPLLEVKDLKTHFTLESGIVRAVDGVSFTLDDGEALGSPANPVAARPRPRCRWSSSCPPTRRIVEGSIKLFGIDLVPKSENAMRRYRWPEISIVFQGAMNALNPVAGSASRSQSRSRNASISTPRGRGSRVGELLELVGIPRARRRSYPHELSGGMRQRAMIAMALACDPAIVIGDEPTTALDVMVQAQILQLLEDLRGRLGLSLILITHDLSVIAETCDRVLIMYAGRVAEEGSVEKVFRSPRHPYTQKLLAAFPNIHADRRTLEVIPGSPPDLRNPPPGCRFAPRCSFAMAVCSEVVPPESDVRRRARRLPPLSRGQRRRRRSRRRCRRHRLRPPVVIAR